MSIKTIQNLVSEVMSEIKTIDAEEAYQMVQNKNCNLIDICLLYTSPSPRD